MDFRAKTSFVGATLAAIGATACCAGPLVLLSLGIGGAWIGSLTALEPYRPIFILLAVVFMAFAYRRLFTTAACEPGQASAVPAVARRQKVIFWVVLGVVAVLASSPWFLPYFF
jgi:mercuric ion transport protein